MTKQSFLKGAAILTLAGISVRFVGAFFRIVLAMFIGDEGIGLFQMAYPVYSTLLAVSTAGVPIAISKLVAENLARGNYRGAYRTFRVALSILALSGFLISALLYLGAEYFAGFLTDPLAYLPLVSISPAIFLVTVMSAYRGFFQGQQQMMPTAISQIAEQLGRVVIALLLVLFLLPMGLEYAAAGASFGAAAGAFCGLLILVVVWLRQKKQFMHRLKRQRVKDDENIRAIIYRIFALSVPITLGSLVMPLITLVDLSIVPQQLNAAGFDTIRARALYGQLTGMATPIIHIPTIITVALAISLVPAMSEALALRKNSLVRERSYLAVRMTLLLGIPSAVGLYLLAEPITVLLFDNAEAGQVLAVLSLGVVFLTLYQTTSAILQGLGRTMDPVITLFWGALIKTGLTWYLTASPQLHIRGAALATVIGFGIAAILNVQRVQRLADMPLRPVETLLKPLVASVGMAVAVLSIYSNFDLLHSFLSPSAAEKGVTLVAIIVGALAYAVLLFLLGGIRREDLLLLPKIGEPLVRLAEKFHLLRG
ncbi:putative polysaccharide biosynthesis protein [Dethiobacter alkaliphilus]|uniref:Polysaccharide biosynthesis protein n=1 Tax=Dethiobacter alkaliphilus AHT 1 TaxID=555088 RepID=C0GIZ3_DETAL|nr:polysaccharide biosynthesis protein [Dethiobacter alkaliphilus]EEG76626.1 polysaccharide biosynthesis protein [Dethiobacter alkaliphilus AHT 1]